MKNVLLKLPVEQEASEYIDVLADFADFEVTLLMQYSALTQRVRECALLQRGMSGFKGLNFDKDGLSIRAGTCTKSELHELLHVLRPVTLERERASFSKVMSVLQDRFAHQAVLKFLKLNQHAFQHGEMSLYFQISIGDMPLFAESLLRTWLNGTQYHTDKKKAEDWAALEAALGEPNTEAVVMSQLHGKVLAILNIDYIAKQILAATTLMPNSSCNGALEAPVSSTSSVPNQTP